MSKVYFLLVLSIMSFVSLCFSAIQEDSNNMANKTDDTNNPVVLIQTTLGDITLELFPNKAPITVENFLKYVKDGQYNQTIFHRVIDGFMIQGGGFTKEMKQKTVRAPIQNEAENGLSNKRGTIAMARTSDVNSATAQFFINLVDNPSLDFRGKNSRDYGYCVFGQVTQGMDVVDKIGKVKTGSVGPYLNVPKETIEIVEAKQLS